MHEVCGWHGLDNDHITMDEYIPSHLKQHHSMVFLSSIRSSSCVFPLTIYYFWAPSNPAPGPVHLLTNAHYTPEYISIHAFCASLRTCTLVYGPRDSKPLGRAAGDIQSGAVHFPPRSSCYALCAA
jgi:hypothetical protein